MLESLFILLGFNFATPQLPPLDILEVYSQPQLISFSEPIVKAKSAIVIDLASGKILFEKNIHARLPIASLTKLMSAVIGRENYSLEDLVVVSKNASKQPPAKIWLGKGEKLLVKDLLKALLIESANDVAVALAEKMGEEEFVKKMNQKAKSLGLKNSHFANPVGYDDEENFSTTFDLAILANYVLRDEVLREIVGTPKTIIFSKTGKAHELYSTNNLFGSYLDIHGLKTGLTEEAGECLAAVAKMKNGRKILTIVLNSSGRFQEAKALITWAEKSHRW